MKKQITKDQALKAVEVLKANQDHKIKTGRNFIQSKHLKFCESIQQKYLNQEIKKIEKGEKT